MNINDAALRYLGTRSRTCLEMEHHLKEKGFDEDKIKELLAEYKGCGYLDDFNYCLEYFRYGFSKGKGKKKVFQELRQRGVITQTAELAFEEYDGDTDETARAAAEASKVLAAADIGEDDKVPEKTVAKVARRLESKGYTADTIYTVIGDLRR